LNNMRRYVTHGPDHPPLFALLDTPANRRCFDQLESIVSDPDDPEDALKVDADDGGDGGDDQYDETRYALASHPLKAAHAPKAPLPTQNYDAEGDRIFDEAGKQGEREKRQADRILARLNKQREKGKRMDEADPRITSTRRFR
ncbi:MAG TPA: hypothetical protein VKD22_10965, partial [Ramlibacter sp.]|nr:hypothetical protein [Ramlibacter sp.]